jgi:hypothetical protein
MAKSFEDYAREAEARAEEEQRLGLTTYDEIQQHYARKVMLGDDYRERYSGSWCEAEEYLKREREKKGGSQ